MQRRSRSPEAAEGDDRIVGCPIRILSYGKLSEEGRGYLIRATMMRKGACITVKALKPVFSAKRLSTPAYFLHHESRNLR